MNSNIEQPTRIVGALNEKLFSEKIITDSFNSPLLKLARGGIKVPSFIFNFINIPLDQETKDPAPRP